jgi:tRNA A-37 threonylcarbamoyl transferase component Bud32
MMAVHVRGFRVERCAAGEAEGSGRWVEVIRHLDRHQVRELKHDGDTTVLAAVVDGRPVVLKRWRLGTVGSRLKALVKMSRGWRHWRGAERLEKAGVRTAKCYALVTQRGEGGPWQWLVMEFLTGKTVLQHLYDKDLTVRQEHAVARAIGRDIRKMNERRFTNRDHKPSNLIVVSCDERGAEVAVIDCVGLVGLIRGIRWTLMSLVLEPIGCGAPPRLTLRLRALRSMLDVVVPSKLSEKQRRVLVKHWWRSTERNARAHGDPTPRMDPLNRGNSPS